MGGRLVKRRTQWIPGRGSYLCKGNNRSKGQKAGRHQYVSGQGPHSGVGNIQVSTQGQQPGMVR